MDGNGRWAQRRLLPRKAGHRAGVKTMQKIVDACFSYGISYVTVYAFSSENKDRPADEVQALCALIGEYFAEYVDTCIEKNIRVVVCGDVSYFSSEIRATIDAAVSRSRDCTAGTLNIALNYGGRDEIVRAVNAAIANGTPVDTEEFSRLLYTADIPDPDMVVRTGGEKRLSNFLLWQCAYSELAFTDTLWPDFGRKELREILQDYARRDRRYGKVKV